MVRKRSSTQCLIWSLHQNPPSQQEAPPQNEVPTGQAIMMCGSGKYWANEEITECWSTSGATKTPDAESTDYDNLSHSEDMPSNRGVLTSVAQQGGNAVQSNMLYTSTSWVVYLNLITYFCYRRINSSSVEHWHKTFFLIQDTVNLHNQQKLKFQYGNQFIWCIWIH